MGKLTTAGRSWRAYKQPGGIFCSPACGCKCKRKDYELAVSRAAAMRKRLGKGWKPVIWENFGWHWSVSKGNITVSRHMPRGMYNINVRSVRQYWQNGKNLKELFIVVRSQMEGDAAKIRADALKLL